MFSSQMLSFPALISDRCGCGLTGIMLGVMGSDILLTDQERYAKISTSANGSVSST